MVRQKKQFRVVDAKSGEDITRSVLAQIIMDEESRGATMLPVNFLRQLISMYGDSMQSVVPHYLEASLEALQRNQSQFRDAMAGALATNPFAELARRNMEMFTAAAAGRKPADAAKAAEAGKPAGDDTKSELAALRAELQEMQKKLDKLGG
jgi:polyhydroxyalkanoate synthesis repressor PhaR